MDSTWRGRDFVAKATGRPGYAPGDLLKLYIYGYLNRDAKNKMIVDQEVTNQVIDMGLLTRTAEPARAIQWLFPQGRDLLRRGARRIHLSGRPGPVDAH